MKTPPPFLTTPLLVLVGCTHAAAQGPSSTARVPDAGPLERVRATGGAEVRHGFARIAVMANQAAPGAVPGHVGVAARATGVPAAGVAQQCRAVAPAVEKQQALVAPLQIFAKGIEK